MYSEKEEEKGERRKDTNNNGKKSPAAHSRPTLMLPREAALSLRVLWASGCWRCRASDCKDCWLAAEEAAELAETGPPATAAAAIATAAAGTATATVAAASASRAPLLSAAPYEVLAAVVLKASRRFELSWLEAAADGRPETVVSSRKVPMAQLSSGPEMPWCETFLFSSVSVFVLVDTRFQKKGK